MGSRYVKAMELLMKLKEEDKRELTTQDFINQIRINIGADRKRTIEPYLLLMVDLNMIKKEGENVIILV